MNVGDRKSFLPGTCQEARFLNSSLGIISFAAAYPEIRASRMKEISKEAVVIGAGWCGIYALKHLAEQGLDCMSFDKREDVGGLWAHTDDQSVTSVPDCTYTSSPKLFTEAVDFPWPDEIGIYPRYDDVHTWLKSYVKHFNLSDRIMLHSEVKSVEKNDGMWVLNITRKDPAKKRAENFVVKSKFLVVSTGVNMVLNDMSDDSRLTGFSGRIMHSNQIRKVSEYQDEVRGKRVVSIGGGENASDLTYFGSRVTKSFTLCIPNGQWMQIRNYLTRTVPIFKVAPVTREKLGHVLPWEYQKCVFRCWVRPMWGSNVGCLV
ncbi:NAD(P)/FAD-dependent oxidoreductase [archaeon]|nr:MAG: NAD(P)/FAD-dependent oxidoreductase [archaeon]